jgi:hypothetical protein
VSLGVFCALRVALEEEFPGVRPSADCLREVGRLLAEIERVYSGGFKRHEPLPNQTSFLNDEEVVGG